jgi:hypothetical protein
MTIGIGVLASASRDGGGKRIAADTAILIADTMGSFGDVDSHQRLHKIIMMPDAGIYAVAAGQIDKAAELLPLIGTYVAELKPETKTYGGLMKAIAMACWVYKQDKFTITELPKMRLPPTAVDPLKVPPELNTTVQARWGEFSIGCDLVMAAFDRDKRAWLFRVDGDAHEINNVSFPGFSAVGSGSHNAIFWLSRRQHTLGLHPVRAAYHAYEAKLMAEGSAHVNEHLDVAIATHEEHWFCTTHDSQHGEKEHPDINIKNLKRWLKRYGIRPTDDLGARK